ncbi:2-methoxy-6-polyprenyl-1,4-benzoquinol methylase, mitochondrial [Dermacentor andersoni]|uniref:2-methoxy-6-polyprenyl-1,4-benzoquinol methylase, mitochondrial n=1 Tax=Dermacentor andersoni TaxID=34620 RepID=UPI002155097F|nr:2-methoxy-6-polyprenyl-1,4-benzoquinol methylase, mitochondrial-like [Dermacentor andersoni]
MATSCRLRFAARFVGRRSSFVAFVRYVSGGPQSSLQTEEALRDHNTNFGYEKVSEHEKAEKVREVFSRVAEKYDLMNDAMSAGIHRLWKDRLISVLGPLPGMQLIDVAGGTGDISTRFIQAVRYQELQANDNTDADLADGSSSQRAHAYVVDINREMLEAGKRRNDLLYPDISWSQGDAEQLPFGDGHFDAYTIAFGIRNVTHIDKVLSEAYRVLKPGGRFLCLEFSQVENPLLRSIYDNYSFQVIPVMGLLLARDWKSYQYLVESIRKFPCQELFKEMIQAAGFREVTYENLMNGVAAIHSGFKL